MGYVGTAEDWLDRMIDWRDSDQSWGDWGDGHNGYADDREGAIRWWQNHIKTPKGEIDLIEYIADMWQIEFEEIRPEWETAYAKYVAEFDPAEGDPVCFCEWLDCEAVELGLRQID